APVHHAAAARIARTNDQIGCSGGDRGDQVGQDGRVVRPVRVHLNQRPGTALERLAETVEIGSAETLLGRAVSYLDLGLAGRELIGDSPGAVGRYVVHYPPERARQAGHE